VLWDGYCRQVADFLQRLDADDYAGVALIVRTALHVAGSYDFLSALDPLKRSALIYEGLSRLNFTGGDFLGLLFRVDFLVVELRLLLVDLALFSLGRVFVLVVFALAVLLLAHL
jgi:hypothetical protein